MTKMFFQTQVARKKKSEYILVTGPSDRETTWRPDTNRDIRKKERKKESVNSSLGNT